MAEVESVQVAPRSAGLPRHLDVARALSAMAKLEGVSFTLNSDPYDATVIFSSTAFLPVIAMQADLLCRAMTGQPLGVTFKRDEAGLFGLSVQIPAMTGDGVSVLRGLMLAHAARRVLGMSPGAAVECMPIYERYMAPPADGGGEQPVPGGNR